MKKNPRHHLAKTVFFRKVGSVVFVRNVATGEEFLFNEETEPILSALRNGATSRSAALRGQNDFIQELHDLGIANLGEEKPKDRLGLDSDRYFLDECTVTKGNLVSSLQEECRQMHHLWSAGIELTYRCNEHCKHCYLDVHEEQIATSELTQTEWMKVVDQLARMGCMNVLVTGGEPTLHPAFLSICERIIQRGMLCDVYTNGVAVSDSLFDSLCKLPLNSISVSLYSGVSKFHDNVTGVPGSFQKTLATLLRFMWAGFNTYAKVPVFHGHLDDFFAARELGCKHGFRVLASTILVPGHSGKSRNEMMMDVAEYRRFLEHETMPDTSVEASAALEKCKNEPLCQAGQSTLCVSPFGDVMPCNSFPAICGNVRNSSLAKIWRTSKLLKRLRGVCRFNLSPRCANCKDIAYCTVCPGASWNEAKGRILPCSWSCEQAHVRAAFNRNTKNQHKGNNNENKDKRD